MYIYKNPEFEDDSYMFVVDLNTDTLKEISLFDLDYYNMKVLAFRNKSIDKENFKIFSDRPSFRDFENIIDLKGTIYTYASVFKNQLPYELILETVKANYKTSRRCNINFADTLRDYMTTSVNTSCLNAIHYYKDNVTVYFRASDIENELLIDLHLIMTFFIAPVAEFKTLTVIASTSQNVHYKLTNLVS